MTAHSQVTRFKKTSVYGNLIFAAGATPREDGIMKFEGMVGRDLDLVDALDAARLAVRNAIGEVELTANSLGARVSACHRMTVYSVVTDVKMITQVADAASDQLAKFLGTDGVGARTAIAVAGLPGNAPVEVELTVSLAR